MGRGVSLYDEIHPLSTVSRRSRRPYRERVRTSIRSRLALSHLVAITASTFVYATGGFILLVLVIAVSGYGMDNARALIPTFAGLTGFVLIQIGLISICGVLVARVASLIVSRRMLNQIVELEAGSNAIASGKFDQPVKVLTQDELGRLATSFNDLISKLGEADRQRRAFVANISHDLRTPIAVIRGHLDAQLHPSGADSIAAETSFAAIDHEIRTLSQLIEDLFISSRIEEGVLPVERLPVDAGAMAQEAVHSVRPYALKTSRVSVNALIDERTPMLLGDATRVTQIINNLVHNAIRHTPAGGVVVVQVEPNGQSGGVRLTVRDTGVGMAPEIVSRIFDRYYQGEDIGEKGGAGLGLSIVKNLAEMQGGQVWAESSPGEGTAITVVLPSVTVTGGSATGR